MMTTGDLLKQGFAALKAGRNAEARSLLIQVVQQDKRNEKAWLWLSAVVDTDEERRICLENVLVINPNNGIAQRGLEALRKSSPGLGSTSDAASREGETSLQPIRGTETGVKFQPAGGESTTNEILQQAVAGIEAGERERGKQLLIEVIEQDENNEIAWLWMTRCVAERDVKRECFERVLAINPHNKHAIEGLKRLDVLSKVEVSTPPSRLHRKRSGSPNRLVTALPIVIVLAAIAVIVFLSWTRILSPITDVIDPNSPKRVARRFLEGKSKPDDISPDCRYEIYNYEYVHPNSPFDEMWYIRSDPRAEYELEVHSVIVRDSLRPDSKEVIVVYSERYNDLGPPWHFIPMGAITLRDYAQVPVEKWKLTGKYIEHEGYAAFLILERQEGRWVVWCAEIEPDAGGLPDKCGY